MSREAKYKELKSGTKLPLLNLKGKDYLQVAHRLVWFREEHRDGIIKTQMMEHQNDGALFRAEIYIAAPNGQPLLVATAHKAENKQSFPDYIEKAETGAIGRALAMAGYGTQFEPEFDEGMRLADAPLSPVESNTATTSVVAETPKTNETQTQTVAGATQSRPSFRRKIAESKGNSDAGNSSDDL